MIRGFASKHCIVRYAVQPGFKLRQLQTSTVVYGFGSHASDNDPEVLEAEKRKNLSGQTKSSMPGHAPGWNERLASDSEAAVKAEKVGGSPEELMEHSVRHIKEGGADASTAGESDPKKQGQAKPSSGSSGFDK
eukprot:jgi/Astpho2/1943/Aster-x0089